MKLKEALDDERVSPLRRRSFRRGSPGASDWPTGSNGAWRFPTFSTFSYETNINIAKNIQTTSIRVIKMQTRL